MKQIEDEPRLYKHNNIKQHHLCGKEMYHMSQRFEFGKTVPEAMKIMLKFEGYVRSSGLDPKMLELIKTRASQINGCAFCLDMHAKAAIALGEDPRRLFGLAAWRDSPFYKKPKRAALALTEAVTLISEGGVSDEIYQEAQKYFSEKQIVDLLVVINVINCWNRFNVTAKTPPDK